MGTCQPAAQGEAQADAGRRLRSIVGRLRERPEQPANCTWGKAGAVVAHAQSQPAARRRDVQVDASVRGLARVLDRVVDQVREDLIDYRDVHAQPCLGIDRLDLKFHAGLLGAKCEAGDQAVEHLGRRDDFATVRRATALE